MHNYIYIDKIYTVIYNHNKFHMLAMKQISRLIDSFRERAVGESPWIDG